MTSLCKNSKGKSTDLSLHHKSHLANKSSAVYRVYFETLEKTPVTFKLDAFGDVTFTLGWVGHWDSGEYTLLVDET